MKRICPHCNVSLKDSDNYFCSNCGYKLDDYLVLHTASFNPKKSRFSPNKKKIKFEFSFNKNVKIALVIIAGFVLISLLAIFLTKLVAAQKKKAIDQPVQTKRIIYNNTIDAGLKDANFVFGIKELTRFVPEDADFFVEGSNFDEFLTKFNAQDDQQLNVKERFGITLNDRFAIYGKMVENGWQYALIAEVYPDEAQALEVNSVLKEAKDAILEDGTEEVLDVKETTEEPSSVVEDDFVKVKLQDGDYQLELVENIVIITKYEAFFDAINKSAQGAAKNITHNQKYSSFSAFLPPDGQLVMMIFNVAPENIYNLMMSFNPSDEVVKMLEEPISKKLDKFVIRKNE